MTYRESPLMVAIWMVTYNHGAYIEQAITSVIRQDTSFRYHLFIGEDYSTDETRAHCKMLQAKYPEKITLVLNESNLGSDINGIQIYERCLASGAKYIALLEGDDYWTDPLKLQKQVDYLEAHPEVVFSFTRFSTLQEGLPLKDKNAHFFKTHEDLVYDFNMFTRGWYGGTLTLVFRSSAITMDNIKMYKYFRDIHLYTELLKLGDGRCLNFDSAVYRIHNAGQHNSLNELERGKTAVLCYTELFLNNKDIPQIQKKYRYFHSEYIKALLLHKKYAKAMIENFKSSYSTSDFYIFKKEMKRIVKHIVNKTD